jgi:hypothetical protein
MKTRCLCLFTVALLVIPCGGSALFGNKSIDLVKKSPWPGGDGTTTVDAAMKQVVGLRGKVEYKAFVAEGEKDNRIETVQIDLTNSQGKAAFVQFSVNNELGTLEPRVIVIDGKADNFIVGGMKLALWALSGLSDATQRSAKQ